MEKTKLNYKLSNSPQHDSTYQIFKNNNLINLNEIYNSLNVNNGYYDHHQNGSISELNSYKIASPTAVEMDLPVLSKDFFKCDEDQNYLIGKVNNTDQLQDSFLLLTGVVRQEYLTYLERLLLINYETSFLKFRGVLPTTKLSTKEIQKYALDLEQKAIKSCMMANLYRESMLDIIDDLRKDTIAFQLNNIFNNRLFSEYSTTPSAVLKRNASTQTNRCKCFDPKKYSNVRIQTELHVHTDSPSHVNSKYFNNQHQLLHNKKRISTTKAYRKRPNDDVTHENNVNNNKSETRLPLDDRIKLFEHNLKLCERKHTQFPNCLKSNILMDPEDNIIKKVKVDRKAMTNYERNSPISTSKNEEEYNPVNVFLPPSALLKFPLENNSITEDNIAKELHHLFGGEDDDDIFGELSIISKPESQEIDNAKCRLRIAGNAHATNVIGNDDIFKESTNCKVYNNGNVTKNIIELENSLTETQEPLEKNIAEEALQKIEQQHSLRLNELKDSLWPCELHMRKIKLHEFIEKISAKGIRYVEKLRLKFQLLFGQPDVDEYLDDDVFGPYSPSLEFNEILINSCKKRIAPWIVKYLMTPMKNGLISNRYLFKKVAKFIAESVIYQNQYPDEGVIERAIADFFSIHDSIQTIYDIN